MNPILLTAIRAAYAVGGPTRTYADILVNDYGATVVFPLVNIPIASSTITAYNDPSALYSGVIGGSGVPPYWLLQNDDGPVPGSLAPFNNGAGYGNILSTALINSFNKDIGSAFLWCTSTWGSSAGTAHMLMLEAAGSANRVEIFRNNNSLTCRYRAGNVSKAVSSVIGTPASLFSCGISWNKPADEVKVYVNGSQLGSTQTGLGTFTSNPLSVAIIGAGSLTPTTSLTGLMSYYAFIMGDVWSVFDYNNIHVVAAESEPDI